MWLVWFFYWYSLHVSISLWFCQSAHSCYYLPLLLTPVLAHPFSFLAGTNPPRPGTFPGASSPGPVADLYGPTSQDSGVGNYISAASPQPGSGFGHSIAVSALQQSAQQSYSHGSILVTSSHPRSPAAGIRERLLRIAFSTDKRHRLFSHVVTASRTTWHHWCDDDIQG